MILRGKGSPLRAFYGRPRTRPYFTRKGGAGYKVHPRELTPLRAKIADMLGTVSAIALAIGSCFYLNEIGEENGWVWLVAIIGAMVAIPVLQWFWCVLLKRRIPMSLDGKRFKRHWLFTWGVHETPAIGGFALAPHRKAQKEAARHEDEKSRAAMRGEVMRAKPYYQDSGVLSVMYHGEYRKVTPIYPLEKAQRTEERMQAVHQKIMQHGVTRSFDPYGGDDEWTNSPGDFS